MAEISETTNMGITSAKNEMEMIQLERKTEEKSVNKL